MNVSDRAGAQFHQFFGGHAAAPSAGRANTHIGGDKILSDSRVVAHPYPHRDFSAAGTLIGDDKVGWVYVDLTPVPFRDHDNKIYRANIPTLHQVPVGTERPYSKMLEKLEESRVELCYDLECAKTHGEKMGVLKRYAATEKNMDKAWAKVKQTINRKNPKLLRSARFSDDKSFLARYRALKGQIHTPEQILQYGKGYDSALSANASWRKWGRVFDRPVIMIRAARDMWSNAHEIGGKSSRNGWFTLPANLLISAGVSVLTIYVIYELNKKKAADPMFITT